jgi:glycosyltransferase involved in cell wall biosynthesis
MKKVLLVGSAPLPNETSGIREAAGLRTEQFLSPLQEAGHTISLIAISNKSEEQVEKQIQQESQSPKTHKNTAITWISRHSPSLKKAIKQSIQTFSPDVAIGVNTFPAYILSTVLPKNIPFWADLNGWIMAEGQARGWQENTNLHLANAFRQERQILLTADKISTVSSAQKFATIGEMASLGLLQKENFLEEKVFALPNCTKFFDIDKSPEKNINTAEKPLFRENPQFSLPPNAFVVAWIGGYNNWVDEKTLFEGLEKAMSQSPNLVFVSTGGAIKNIANTTFSSFLSRIDKSPYKDRFIFLGWIETSDMRKIYAESDAGINIDFLCIETETGARNRINEMLKFGLPVITTGGSEIAEKTGQEKAGICIKNGNSEALSKAIASLQKLKESNFEEFSQYGHNGQRLSTQIFSDKIIQTPVLNFVENPKKTVLKALPIQNPFFFLKNAYWYFKKNGIKIFWAKIQQKFF